MKTNLTIDLTILLIFLVGFEPALTGGAAHEWLNLAFGAVMLVHLVMHWNWIKTSLDRKPTMMSRLLKVNVLLNVVSFVVLVMMVLSGLMISRYVFGSGAAAARGSTWRELHETFANLLLFLVGLHFALHWKCFSSACARYLLTPLRARFSLQPGGERRAS
jgi:cytochrome b